MTRNAEQKTRELICAHQMTDTVSKLNSDKSISYTSNCIYCGLVDEKVLYTDLGFKAEYYIPINPQ